MPDLKRLISIVSAVVACVGVLSVVACAPTAPAASSPAPLSSEEAGIFVEMMRLEDTRSAALQLIEEAARAESPAVRERAALAFGRLREPAGGARLVQLLEDRDTAVAAAAAFALGQLGDSSFAEPLAVAMRARSAGRWTVSAEAAYALGRLPGIEADAALRELLAATPVVSMRNGEPVASALLATWRHPPPGDLEPILRWTASGDAELRWRAAYALVRRPTPAAVTRLHQLGADQDPRVRAVALRGLTASAADSAGIAESVRSLLISALDDPDYAVRINAARTLGTYSQSLAAVDALVLALLGGERHLAFAAGESLGRIGAAAASAAAALADLAADEGRHVALRQVALEALAQVHPGQGRQAADALAVHHAWRLRASAARVLASPGIAQWGAAARLGRDPDGRVAAAALQALSQAAVADPVRDRGLLVESLASPDVGVRTAAITALGRAGEPWALPLLLDAYERAAEDDENDAALAAVDAIARFAGPDSVPGRAFFARFSRSPDYLVRLRARERFGSLAASWGDPLPIELGNVDYRALLNASRQPYAAPRIRLETDAGDIELRLHAADAPLTVASFLSLARQGYFDGQEWPRVVPNFVVQGGDPRGDTSGGPGYSIRDEINRHRYGTGRLGMALSGPDTGGSQWFITHSPQPHLDGIYTIFGEVVSGQDVTERILPGDRIHRIQVLQ